MTYTQRIIISACIFISMIAISWGFNKIFFKNKHTTWQDILSTTLGRVLPYIFLLIGTYIIIHLWSIPEPYYTLTHKALFAMAIIAASFIIASAITASIKIYAKNGQHTIAAMTLTRNMANALILVLGLLVLLSYLGIAIAPMLTAQ